MCNYWIAVGYEPKIIRTCLQAPPGMQIQINITSMWNEQCSWGCLWAGLELKTEPNQRATSPRFSIWSYKDISFLESAVRNSWVKFILPTRIQHHLLPIIAIITVPLPSFTNMVSLPSFVIVSILQFLHLRNRFHQPIAGIPYRSKKPPDKKELTILVRLAQQTKQKDFVLIRITLSKLLNITVRQHVTSVELQLLHVLIYTPGKSCQRRTNKLFQMFGLFM